MHLLQQDIYIYIYLFFCHLVDIDLLVFKLRLTIGYVQ
jgi:hypothetical protein